MVTRSRLRAACTPAILLSGAIGYGGGTVLLQNAGITRTSVSHAALLIGSVPVMVAIVAALWHRAVAKRVAWPGSAYRWPGWPCSRAAAGPVRRCPATCWCWPRCWSTVFTVAQDRLLPGRDPAAVTAAQFLGAALASAPPPRGAGCPRPHSRVAPRRPGLRWR